MLLAIIFGTKNCPFLKNKQVVDTFVGYVLVFGFNDLKISLPHIYKAV